MPNELLSFWQWSSSDILGNTLRGVLAEYIIHSDIGTRNKVRQEWDAYDLLTDSGIKVEVKSASYLQSWDQKKLSTISFGIQPTYGWDAKANTESEELKRQADVYVFCVLTHKDKATVDPLNMNQWEFYIISTKTLNTKIPKQKTITLSSLLKLNPLKCSYGEVKSSIKAVTAV